MGWVGPRLVSVQLVKYSSVLFAIDGPIKVRPSPFAKYKVHPFVLNLSGSSSGFHEHIFRPGFILSNSSLSLPSSSS